MRHHKLLVAINLEASDIIIPVTSFENASLLELNTNMRIKLNLAIQPGSTIDVINHNKMVAPPVGARVGALPNGYKVFELDGKVYYHLDDSYYKAVVVENGTVAYEVVRGN